MSKKILKPQIKYLSKLIDKDIENQKNFLVHLTEWMQATKTTDKYYETQSRIANKKIYFAEQCKANILNFT